MVLLDSMPDWVLYLFSILAVVAINLFIGTISAQPDSLSTSKNLHLPRRVQHASTGFVLCLLLHILAWEVAVLAALTGTFLFFLVDVVRRRVPSVNRVFLKLVGPILRQHELNNPPAALFFLFGVCFVVLFYPLRVAALAILFVSFADPLAAIVGILVGGPKVLPNKSVAGCAASFVVSFLLTGIYVTIVLPAMSSNELPFLLGLSLMGACSGFLGELVPAPACLDDNLTIPVVSGGVLWLLGYIFGTRFLLAPSSPLYHYLQ